MFYRPTLIFGSIDEFNAPTDLVCPILHEKKRRSTIVIFMEEHIQIIQFQRLSTKKLTSIWSYWDGIFHENYSKQTDQSILGLANLVQKYVYQILTPEFQGFGKGEELCLFFDLVGWL